ncbi:AAEL005630-PA [Aedes aegypti]|uniref:AAEL005630-PA n=2 Tax=Aedes aegypti TaxID=7159 RepID=A0A1S4FBE8_AEDAE|nr:uncharacterized protein LOC5566764 [Aedes aegypti]EAT42866.1 AAEL005630-PA [Aedes aegypti]
MEGSFASSEIKNSYLEGDILQAKSQQDEKRLSIDNALINARNVLLSHVGENGDNLFSLLMRLISRILVEKPGNAVDLFEEYCRLVKQGHFVHPDLKLQDVKGAEHERKVEYARSVQRKVRSLEHLHSAPMWSQIGFTLPPSMDYFVDRQMELLRQVDGAKHVMFWGVVHTLSGSYYVIEMERDSFEAVQLELQLSQEKTEIARDVIEGLLRATVSDDTIISDWCGAESMVMEMIDQILEFAIPPDSDEQLATAVAVPVLDRIVEEAIDEAQEPEVELSMMGSLDVISCNATLASSDLSLNQLKFASAKALLEVKMNVFRYYVSSDPVEGQWTELPTGITLDKIINSCEIKRYFKGDLDAKLAGGFVERDHLRAVLARISMDRRACCRPSDESTQSQRLITERDVAIYYKATGFRRGWRQMNNEQIPKSAGWRKSDTWPGSYAYGKEFFIYSGWGIEGGC